MTRTYFITATGTESGKTYVAARICRAAVDAGLDTLATKPVLSDYTDDQLATCDAGVLAAALGQTPDIDAVNAISPLRYKAALAPNRAAALEGATLLYDDLIEYAHKRMALQPDLHLIEGAGGVMAPLTDDRLNLDLAADLDIPAILVAPTYLGAISHTLTAITALAERGVKIAAIVLNDLHNDPAMTEIVAGDVARFAPIAPIYIEPKAGEATVGKSIADALIGA